MMTLRMYVSLLLAALSVQMSPRRQKIDAGLPATLTCNVTGGPYSEVVWYKNGNRLIFNNNTRYSLLTIIYATQL